MNPQLIVFLVIGVTLVLFIDGRLRYDFVSLAGLLVLGITRVIEPENVFLGFSHPAVITVASVLVISDALIKTGVMDSITMLMNRSSKGVGAKVMGLMIITAGLSGFMNNVGALAIILPIAISVAHDSNQSPSKFLMPVAFASLLGGMMTSIGTPPNLIVSSYRVQMGYEPFEFFAFAPVGVVIVVLGILFITLIGWKLIPVRKGAQDESLFNTDDYLSEVVVTSDSKVVGKSLMDLYQNYKLEIEVLSILRNEQKIVAPRALEQLLEGDVLIIKANTSELSNLIEKTGLKLKGAKLNFLTSEPYLKSDSIELVEVVLRGDSLLIGRTAIETKLRNRFNVNLVAVSRKGVSSFERLKSFRFRPGDILLIQVPVSLLQDTYSKLGCLPLAERDIQINTDKTIGKQVISLGLFAFAIIMTTLGIVPVQLAFATTAVALVFIKIITPREFYRAIEWPTIIMLGSLLPLGDAFQSSGGSDTIANLLINISQFLPPWSMVVVTMIMTMILTNLIGNSASAVLMAPIAVSLSMFMNVSPDSLLMAVAIGSSSAFLTPIGHQSNMLVMGPGGYKFTDYWKLGLPLSLIVLVAGTGLILRFWPL